MKNIIKPCILENSRVVGLSGNFLYLMNLFHQFYANSEHPLVIFDARCKFFNKNEPFC